MRGVAKQGKTQVVLFIEFLLVFFRVRADTDNGNALFIQFGQCVPHRLGLLGSPGGACLWVKKDEQTLAPIIGQSPQGPILIPHLESRCLVTCCQFRHKRLPWFNDIGKNLRMAPKRSSALRAFHGSQLHGAVPLDEANGLTLCVIPGKWTTSSGIQFVRALAMDD